MLSAVIVEHLSDVNRIVQFSRREIRYRTSVWKGLSLRDHCSLLGGIP